MSSGSNLRKHIGIIGGGQLGKMLIEAAQPWNTFFHILESSDDAPASRIADSQIVGTLTDDAKIRELASKTEVLTYEIEHVGVETLKDLEDQGVRVVPSPRILEIIKDKGLQKQFYADHGLPTAPFRLVNTPEEWLPAAKELGITRFAAKSRTDGYDGKGVALCSVEELERTGNYPFTGPTLIESFVDCEKELSVIVARKRNGEVITFPTVEMEFDPVANLVEFLACPARIDQTADQKAKGIAIQCIEAFDGEGLFAVELFLTKNGDILVNEIAPRPHNSGHHTIEANYTSQYEQLNRILLDLPLGATDLIQPAVMVNLLGSEGVSGTYAIEGLDELLALPGVYIHLYGKAESRPKRKMGHATVLAPTLDEAIRKARLVQEKFRFIKA
ncbi:MAG: 5-(carboxyamino)imidazole ribonucleotide synthase [Bacteroidetes bacterium]|nr:MAG: 5-(carboxyamino)imidazole ribonucleotide synthase [Bacteroidota bacterium]